VGAEKPAMLPAVDPWVMNGFSSSGFRVEAPPDSHTLLEMSPAAWWANECMEEQTRAWR
jgi:hypothetical protein